MCIILSATNRPESLDPALTRPGRFDRRVPVELPDLLGREAILKVHARKIKAEPDVDYHTIARMAAGASGAELANIINEAALRAVRDGRSVSKPGGSRGEHRDCYRRISEEKCSTFRSGKEGRGISRDRARSWLQPHADAHRSCPEDHHHTENFRCAGIYSAGGAG